MIRLEPAASDLAAGRLELSEFIRSCWGAFFSLKPGEEELAFDRASERLAVLLNATVFGRWDVSRYGEPPNRRFRWVKPGNDIPDIPTTVLPVDSPVAQFYRSITEPMIISDLDQLKSEGLVSTAPLASQLSRLIVPGLSDDSSTCLLIISRSMEEPWQAWETKMVLEFARLIPIVRHRSDEQAQALVTFREAPIGITIRSESGALLSSNRAFRELLGRPDEDELVGTHLIELLAHSELSPEMCDVVENLERERRRGIELPFQHFDGSIVWGRLAMAPIETHRGLTWLTHVEDITQLRKRQAAIQKRATRDGLTGLANRTTVHESIDAQLAAGSVGACAVVMLDLNGFKFINDTYGHAAGDHALVEVGKLLESAVRATDVVGRYGGDEFVVVLGGPITLDDAQAKAADIKRRVCESSFCYEGTQLEVGTSIGVSIGRAGDTPEDLVAVADHAMFADKQAGRPAVRGAVASR